MTYLLVVLLLPILRTVNASCAAEHGLWVPASGDCFALVIQQLATDRQELKKLNPDWNVDDIYPGMNYSVPIKKALHGALWTNDCPPRLALPADRDRMKSLLCVPSSSSASAFTTESLSYLEQSSSLSTHGNKGSGKVVPTSPIDRKDATSTFTSTKLPNGKAKNSASSSVFTEYDKPITQPYGRLTPVISTISAVISTGTATRKFTEDSKKGTAASTDVTSVTVSTEIQETFSTADTAEHSSAHEISNTDHSEYLKSHTTQLPEQATEDQINTKTATISTTTCLTKGHDTTESALEPQSTTTSIASGNAYPATLFDDLATNIKSFSLTENSHKTTRSDAKSTAYSSTTLSTWKRKDAITSDTISSHKETSTHMKPTTNSKATTTDSKVTTTDSKTTTTVTKPKDVTKTQSLSRPATTKPGSTFVKKTSTFSSTVTTASTSQTDLPKASCGKESDLPGHADVSEQGARLTATEWCNKYADGYLAPGDECVSHTIGKFGVGFNYTICREDNCVSKEQDMKKPLGDDGPSCKEIMLKNNWEKCEYAEHFIK